MRNHRFQLVASCFLLAGATALSLTSGCSGSEVPLPEEHLGEASQDLDEAQCIFFDVDGKDTICHHTTSVSHPFTLIRVSDQACINAHSAHTQDYIASLDPSCSGQGCLPNAAPCDGTLACCTGSCMSGTCVESSCPCNGDPACGGSCACDLTFIPVCGTDGCTYTNACSADCFGVVIASDGECP